MKVSVPSGLGGSVFVVGIFFAFCLRLCFFNDVVS